MPKQKQKKSSSSLTARPVKQRKKSREQTPGGMGNMLRQYQLRVTPANDQYESEADEMARRVAAMQENQVQQQDSVLSEQVTPLVQRQETAVEEEEAQAKRIQRQEIEEEEEAQAKRIQRQEAEEEEEAHAKRIQRQETEEEEEAQARRIQRQETEEEEEVQAKRIQRQESEEEEEDLQASGTQLDKGGRVSPKMEERIRQLMQGGGRPLDKKTREYFEPRFGSDFSQIRVHDDAEAAQIAGQMNSRAFTQGAHIFFGQGQYQPQSSAGRELLAHELTHTIQQGAVAASGKQQQKQKSVQRDVIQRNGGSTTTTATPTPLPDPYRVDLTTQPPQIHLGTLALPEFKGTGRRRSQYVGNPLFRAAFYRRGNPDQAGIWDSTVNSSGIRGKLQSAAYGMHPSGTYYMRIKPGLADRLSESTIGPEDLRRIGNAESIAPGLLRPTWDNEGRFEMFHVDHIAELQVAGWPRATWANNIDNMELLSSHANTSSGTHIRNSVNSSIDNFLQLPNAKDQLRPRDQRLQGNALKNRIKETYDLHFNDVNGSKPNPPRGVKFWTRNQIEAGQHMDSILRQRKTRRVYEFYDLENPRPNNHPLFLSHPSGGEFQRDLEIIRGAEERFVIYWRGFGGQRGWFHWGQSSTPPRTSTESDDIQGRDHRQFPGMYILHIEYEPGQAPGESLRRGLVEVFPYRGSRGQIISSSGPIEIPIRPISGLRYAGYFDQARLQQLQLRLDGMSAIEVDRVVMEQGVGLVTYGRIAPSVPLISRARIDIVVTPDDIRAQRTFDIGDFDLPGPFQITSSNLTVALGINSGISVNGRMDFGINRVGQGYLGGRAQTGRPGAGGEEAGFALEGGFNFDSELFDEASINLAYSNNEFSGSGRLTIGSGKIRGIESASFDVTYASGIFTASGTAQFAAPGIQNAGLNLTYSEEEGLTIGGTVQLGEVPGLRGGSLEAEIQRKPDGSYKVSATGTAQPAIPGINSQVTLSYDDGIFDANVTASYSRGMLNGELTLGATNRPVDPDSNQPTGDPQPSNVRAYGGGQVTVRLAPWLQGTVGIKLLPNAEIELRGEIGLPNALELFPRRSVEKNIFTINIDIPIVGVAVAGQRIGIFATVGGGLDVSAGFGPGQLRELSLGITYNPDHEDQTHVTGRGQLHVPADAGLRLFVRGGLGAGIPIVSATAGLEVSGELGLQGALEANVNVDWMPTKGLEINANAGIFVEPKLRLSVDAYVDVSADLVLTTVELYSNRWNLAGVEYGSGLRFGINFPIHYKEGEPFDISLDDIEFTVPDINARSVIAGVLDQF